MISINEPYFSKTGINFVIDTIESKDWRNDSLISKLEMAMAKATDSMYAVAVSNATVGLELALDSLHLKPGNEVITSPFTFKSTITAIIRQGGIPVFADVLDDFTIDPESVKKVITSKTQVIMPVHMFGYPADMDSLKKIAEANGLDVIEDASQALGAKYKSRKVGSLGTAAVFSFYSTKNVGCGEGGMITTNDPVIYERCVHLREPCIVEHRPWDADNPILLTGSNRRLNGIVAGLALDGVLNIKKVNPVRYNNAMTLQSILGNHPHFGEHVISAWNTYPILSEQRDKLAVFLELNGIETKIYYTALMNKDNVYQQFFDVQETPRAEYLSERVLSLPVHHNISEITAQFIGGRVKSFETDAAKK